MGRAGPGGDAWPAERCGVCLMRAARLLGGLALLLAMLGWSAWFVICNVYEFSPALDPLAFTAGWLLSAAVWAWSLRDRRRQLPWLPWVAAACIGGYLLLIHRGMSAGTALVLFGASAVCALAMHWWQQRRSRRV